MLFVKYMGIVKMDKKYIVLLILIFVIPLLVSYFVFAFNGFIPSGDVSKDTWLSFWGGYLTFYGTVFLGIIAIWQNNRAKEQADKANELNEQLMNLEAKSKIGYFEVCLERSKYPILTIFLRNVGDDFVNIKSISININNSKDSNITDELNDYTIFIKDEIPIKIPVSVSVKEIKNMPITIVFEMENSRGYDYIQKITFIYADPLKIKNTKIIYK